MGGAMAEVRAAEYQPLLASAAQELTWEQPSAPSLLDSQPNLSGSQNAQARIAEWAEMGYTKSTETPSVKPPDAEVSPNEVRRAASLDPYPRWIYGALVPPETSAGSPEGPKYFNQPPPKPSVQALHEDDIRELLVDHVNRHCCWGGKPVKKWDIQQVEDCNVYIGTLETFFEERNVLSETEPYTGGPVDGKEHGYIPGLWEVDMRKDFPLLFTPVKEALTRLPHSEEVLECSDCAGRGEVACPICNAGQEPGTLRPGVLTECPDCYGRGLIAHEDGSDTHCHKCGGIGKLRCTTCSSRGLIKCKTCAGKKALLGRKILVVRWRTLQNRKVSAPSNAASVPDDIFHQAQGVELHNGQSYQCQPVQFPDSYWVTKLSSDVIAERNPVPPAARIICERHTLSYVPVTRVVMSYKGKSFKSYVVGLKKEVYMKDYPSRCCCGCCSCQSSCAPCCIL